MRDYDRIVRLIESLRGDHVHVRSGAFMVRKGRWKLVYYLAVAHQLFDLEADPQELHDLYDQEPGVAAELETDLRRICSPEEENRRAHAFEWEQLEIVQREEGDGSAS